LAVANAFVADDDLGAPFLLGRLLNAAIEIRLRYRF